MIGFRDMTFCAAHCANTECHRQFTAKDEADARRWWGGDDYPVAYADFSPRCDDYVALPQPHKEPR